MKYSGSDNEMMCGGPVDTILMNSSWGGSSEFFMDTSHKIMDSSHDDSNTKSTMDVLDSLIMNSSQSSNFAELKPLPPFTGYTGHLSINGIPGHHYHAIAAPQSPQSPHENNNNPNQINNNVLYKNHNGLYYSVNNEHSVVSSTVDCGLVKSEPFVDYGGLIVDNIEDIAAIIGSAIADTTVPNVVDTLVSVEDPNGSRDSWMDLDAWIDTACSNNDPNQQGKTIISPESLQEFNNTQYTHEGMPSSTLQNLLTQNQYHIQNNNNNNNNNNVMKREPVSSNYQMPLLQSRLQNGPPMNGIKENYMKNEYTILKTEYINDCPEPSSTSYLNKDIMLSHSTSGSPPGVVSTTDTMNGRYQAQRNRYGGVRCSKSGSPDLLNGSSLDGLVGSNVNNNFPHTTTTTTPSKKNRSRSSRKQQQQQQQGSIVYDGSLLGKEKPVHRCTICSRGFLNKSNIKVHLRTHTGEKPFRCEVCGKAFRQKAHLIKHQRMHKGVGRD